MTEQRTVYGVLEDDPTILRYHGDGSARGYVYDGNDWKDANPADISVKARVIEESAFQKRFPDIGLPAFRK